jgi:hypothetical protein
MGKHKYIESPEKMWELFEAYRNEVKGAPKLSHDFVGKDGMSVYREKEVPLTLEGFEDYCFTNNIINDLGDYFSNKNNEYSDYSTICRAIKRAIRRDQIEGGMAGIYNPSITQRLNNLTEKVETDNKHQISKLEIEILPSGIPPATSEKDVKL